jgi:hypothetical protein
MHFQLFKFITAFVHFKKYICCRDKSIIEIKIKLNK